MSKHFKKFAKTEFLNCSLIDHFWRYFKKKWHFRISITFRKWKNEFLFFFTSKGMLVRCKCASIKSMIYGLKLLIKLWIFTIFSIIWFYLLDHYLGFPKWYKTLFSVKNFWFYKSFNPRNQQRHGTSPIRSG